MDFRGVFESFSVDKGVRRLLAEDPEPPTTSRESYLLAAAMILLEGGQAPTPESRTRQGKGNVSKAEA